MIRPVQSPRKAPLWSRFIACGLIGMGCLLHSSERSVEAQELTFRVQKLALDANEGIDIADVDQDGQPDLVAGRNWYRGPEFTPRPLRLIEDWNGYTTSNGDFAYDVNGDGWPDVIAGGFLQTEIFWYENPGEAGLKLGHVWKKHLLVDTKLSQNEGNLFLDLNGDGQPELIVNSWNKNNPLCAWKLIPTERTETVSRKQDGKTVDVEQTVKVPGMSRWLIGNRGNGHGMAVGDLNNDGRLDILVGDGWFEQPAENADSDPWKYHADWTDLKAAVPCVITDVNGNGKNDVIWSRGHDYGLFWWEITGQNADGSLEWIEHEIDRSFSQAHALVLADLDGDGQQELITGKRYRAHNGNDPGANDPVQLFYFKWNAAEKKFQRYDIQTTAPVGIGLQIRVHDLNGNGRPDIALSGKSGTYIVWNEGPSKAAP